EQSSAGLVMPGWEALMDMASRCHEGSRLGYVGVDFVLHRNQGPLILELNGRPRLSIQIPHGNGLDHRLARVEVLQAAGTLSADPAERVAFAKQAFATE